MNKEQSPTSEKEKRPQYEIELEERPQPQDGESLDKWLKRIGGPNVEIVKNLEKYSQPRMKKDRPLMIDSKGGIILNDKNIIEIYGEENAKKWKEQIDGWMGQDIPHIKKEKGIYCLEKELFSQNPDIYFQSIGKILGAKHGVVADKRFGKSVEKWARAEKASDLDQQIEQKKKEIEEIEIGYNIHYSRVVQDLLGLYYKERLKDLKGLKRELKELENKKEEEPRGIPEEVPEETVPEETVKEIPVGMPEEVSEEFLEEMKKKEKGELDESTLKKIAEMRAIKKRLEKISKEIKESGVLGRSAIEKEQRRLEKRFKKLK